MKNRYKEVHFDKWCKCCKYEKNSESESPCDRCLEHPINEFSHKPVNYTKPNNKTKKKVQNGDSKRASRKKRVL